MASNLLLSPEIQVTYDRTLLQRFRTNTVFNKFGLQRKIPARGGREINFRRMEIIRPTAVAPTIWPGTTASPGWPADSTATNAAAIALTEGTFLTASVVASWYSTSATVRQYGQAAYISDFDIEQAIDPQVSEYVNLVIEVCLN